MRYKRYPRYKDSDIEWIGEIPEGWETCGLRHLFTFTAGLSITKDDLQDEGVDCINYGDIHSKYTFDLDLSKDSLPKVDRLHTTQRPVAFVQTGDFIFCDTSEDLAGSGNCVFIRNDNSKEVFAGSHTVVAKPKKEFDSAYMGYLLKSECIRSQFQQRVAGVKVYSVTQRILKEISVLIPSAEEQQSIANFLDRKVSQIDSLITDQQKLIELLEGKRSGLITHAVTKGLDPDVPMKDSGIEWIGEIPEGWDTKRLKHCTFINKKSLSEDTEGDYEFTYIDIGSVNSKGVISGLQNVTFGTSPGRARRILSKGDTIVSTVRTYLQSVAYFENPKPNLVCSTGFAVLTPKQEYLVPKYLYYLISSRKLIHEIMRRSVGVSYPAINASELGNLHCLIPDKYIQEEIVDYLDSKIVDIGHLVSDIQRSIELLEEYKQSLITAAVTGKIDVREGGVHSA